MTGIGSATACQLSLLFHDLDNISNAMVNGFLLVSSRRTARDEGHNRHPAAYVPTASPCIFSKISGPCGLIYTEYEGTFTIMTPPRDGSRSVYEQIKDGVA